MRWVKRRNVEKGERAGDNGVEEKPEATKQPEPGKKGPAGEDARAGGQDGEKGAREIPKVFLSYPVRNELVKWEKREDRTVVLIYRKNLSRFERWLQRHIGGPLDIKRPLDAPGSRIWELCDRQHTLLDICRIIDEEFKEEMDPVFDKVRRFLEQLLILNLVILKTPEEIAEESGEDEETG